MGGQQGFGARAQRIVGPEGRLNLIAADIVAHWERRREALFGKGMIVVMSRRIAVRLYEKIVALRPDWHDPDPTKGVIKVVMTGSTDGPAGFQPHVYTKDVRKGRLTLSPPSLFSNYIISVFKNQQKCKNVEKWVHKCRNLSNKNR